MPAPQQITSGTVSPKFAPYYVAGPKGFDWGAAWWSSFMGSMDPYLQAKYAQDLKNADPAVQAQARARVLQSQVRFHEQLSAAESDRMSYADKEAERAHEWNIAEQRNASAERVAGIGAGARTRAAAITATERGIRAGRPGIKGQALLLKGQQEMQAAATAARDFNLRFGPADKYGDPNDPAVMAKIEADPMYQAYKGKLREMSVITSRLAQEAAALPESDAAKQSVMAGVLSVAQNGLVDETGAPLLSAQQMAELRGHSEAHGIPAVEPEIAEIKQYVGGASAKPAELKDVPEDDGVEYSRSTSSSRGGGYSGNPEASESYARRLEKQFEDEYGRLDSDFEAVPKVGEPLSYDDLVEPGVTMGETEEERKKRLGLE